MESKDVLARLEALQAVDLRVREIEKMREVIPGRINELLAESRAKEAVVAQIDARLAEVEREQRMLAAQAQDYTSKLQRLQAQQQEVKNQKEYETILREIDAHKKHKSHFEDETLKSMEIVEQTRKTRAAAAEEVEQSRAAVASQIAELEAKSQELAQNIASEQADRQGLTADIPADILRRYDQIRARRGKAVVAVTGGVCQGCNRSIPPQLYNIILRLTSLEQCPGCQRFLFTRAAEPAAS